jgi:hypothetical protein
MASSGMRRPVGLVRSEVSEEHASSIFMLVVIRELETTLAVTNGIARRRDSAINGIKLPSFCKI